MAPRSAPSTSAATTSVARTSRLSRSTPGTAFPASTTLRPGPRRHSAPTYTFLVWPVLRALGPRLAPRFAVIFTPSLSLALVLASKYPTPAPARPARVAIPRSLSLSLPHCLLHPVSQTRVRLGGGGHMQPLHSTNTLLLDKTCHANAHPAPLHEACPRLFDLRAQPSLLPQCVSSVCSYAWTR